MLTNKKATPPVQLRTQSRPPRQHGSPVAAMTPVQNCSRVVFLGVGLKLALN